MAKLQPGKDTMLFKGPIPKFKYEANSCDRGLAIGELKCFALLTPAGGSGITPMYQLIAHSLTLPDDKTKWTLLFSNVTEQDICEYVPA
jgi:NAD(P)H-flavin reductase